MGKGKPLGIRQTLWLSIGLTVSSTILGASGLYSYQIYQSTRRAEHMRVKAIAETYAIQLQPLILGMRSELSRFVEGLAWHSDTCLLAVLDKRNKPIAVRGYESLLDSYSEVMAKSISTGESYAWHVQGDRDRKLPALTLTTVPVFVADTKEPVGTVVCAARLCAAVQQTASEVSAFVYRLLLISATGLVLGIFWLKRKVLEPLTLLSRKSKGIRNKGDRLSLPTERKDEIGDLARTLSKMSVDIDEWQTRADKLEKSVSQRVAAETDKMVRKLQHAEKMSWTDPLTQLGNRLLLEDKFAEIFESHKQADQDLSVVMMDIDHLRKVNDNLGQKAGDELLKFVGELLRQHLRGQDLAIRYGGDEFLMILPAVSAQDARSIAERTVCMLAQHGKLLGTSFKPTMSAGVASLRGNDPASAGELIGLADKALYEAKRAGQARVAIYQADSKVAATTG